MAQVEGSALVGTLKLNGVDPANMLLLPADPLLCRNKRLLVID